MVFTSSTFDKVISIGPIVLLINARSNSKLKSGRGVKFQRFKFDTQVIIAVKVNFESLNFELKTLGPFF